MNGRSADRESGFTLVEIVIAVAIVATTVAAGFAISLASRSLAVSTAAGEFDQFLDSARTMARNLDGATLAFTADVYGDGTEVRLLAGGPNGPPAPTTLPTLHARATIEEAESLGKAPFAFIVHANGSLSGRPGYRVGDTTTNDVGCPPSGAFHFVIKAAGGSADRFVPCRIKLAANGPVTLVAWPLASAAPSPTPCSSGPGCTATSLPSAPTSTASCPPNYTAIAGGCTPVPPTTSGARYHVTITGVPASLNIGASGSFTVQATLTNPTAVPAGIPASIPVDIHYADTTCTTTPPGWQTSGASFTVTAVTSGTCTLMAGADPSGVAGATSDTRSVSITISAVPTPGPTPTAASCDLMRNQKCYRRIVDQTTQAFYKYVLPDSNCDAVTCWYIDSIKQTILDPTYAVLPPVAPTSQERELLFSVNAIQSVTEECQPFSSFATVPGTDAIQWKGNTIGGPVQPPVGFGQPSVYSTINHFTVGSISTGSLITQTQAWPLATTLQGLYDSVAARALGSPFLFTYSSQEATAASYVQWYPDFPGCDVAGDVNFAGQLYGISGVVLQFEIYQAQPT